MIKILVGGDFAPKQSVAKSLIDNDLSFLNELKDLASKNNYCIINLESPITDVDDQPITKFGPNLQAPKETVTALKYIGVDMVTLANNHILDYGESALLRTKLLCESSGIKTIGVGRNIIEAQQSHIIMLKGKRIGIINCCEHEYSIASKVSAGANPLNTIAQYKAIQNLKDNVDYIIVIVHGGHERFQLPSPRMCETYRFFIDAGADAVINHHQHCYSGYEFYNSKPIIYGLGNLIFENMTNADYANWHLGYLVSVNFDESDISIEIFPYKQCVDGVNFKLLPKNAFDEEFKSLNNIITNEDILEQEINKYYGKILNYELSLLEPYTNKYLCTLKKRGLLPSFITRQFMLRLQNHIECEAHLDKLRFAIKQSIVK